METRIDGIPCRVVVTYFEPYEPATWHEPASGGEIEFEIFDRKGYRAKWLEDKLTEEDETRIYHEYMKHLDDIKNDY